MGLKIWVLEKHSIVVKKAMGREEHVDTISLYPNLCFLLTQWLILGSASGRESRHQI